MPIETFAVFVAEQAVGIAVGVVAVAVAPKVVPGLAKAAKRAQEKGSVALAGSVGGIAIAGAPIKDASDSAYAQVVRGLQWYGEQWDDLFADARAMQPPLAFASDQTIGTVLASASAATDLPGYLRLNVKPLRGNSMLAARAAEELNALPGMTKVRVSAASGTVLLEYDSECYDSAETLRQTFVVLNMDVT